jgi:hypothetical protein
MIAIFQITSKNTKWGKFQLNKNNSASFNNKKSDAMSSNKQLKKFLVDLICFLNFKLLGDGIYELLNI